MRSLHGMHVHGFPNMFVLGHTQGGFTVNYPHLLDEASRHMAYLVRHALDHDVATVEATEDAEASWLRDARASRPATCAPSRQQCTPGYYNNEGQPGQGGFLGSSYGKGPMAFFELLADWREAGTFEGLELRP